MSFVITFHQWVRSCKSYNLLYFYYLLSDSPQPTFTLEFDERLFTFKQKTPLRDPLFALPPKKKNPEDFFFGAISLVQDLPTFEVIVIPDKKNLKKI